MALENIRLLESRMRHERMAAMGQTTAYLSHYIRNIAQGLRSGADVIEMGLRTQKMDPIAQGWKILKRNLDRTLLLTTNMLTFGKDRKPVVETAQLNRVIEDVVSLTQGQADEKSVMLLTDLEEMPAIPLDADGIHHVLLNIVTNAVDACPEQSGRVVVKSCYRAAENRAVVTVSDNGHGIPADQIPHVFDAFHSTKGHGGTGLGLAAARKVMDEIRGSIDVTSTVGEGTTFTVNIPVADSAEGDSERTLGQA
jgi:signal transduction histidine kinase